MNALVTSTNSTRCLAVILAFVVAACGSTRSLDPNHREVHATIVLRDSSRVMGTILYSDRRGVKLEEEVHTYEWARIARIERDTLSAHESMLRESVRNSSQAATYSGVTMSIVATFASILVVGLFGLSGFRAH